MNFDALVPSVELGELALPQINANFIAAAPFSVFGPRIGAIVGLTYAWIGGRWGGNLRPHGTQLLAASSTTYMVVERGTSLESFSTSATNWNNTAEYARVGILTTNASGITDFADYRAGPDGVFGSDVILPLIFACSDLYSDIAVATSVNYFVVPFDMVLTMLPVATLLTAQASGSVFSINIKKNGVGIFSTLLTIDNNELTSRSAVTPCALSTTSFSAGDRITFDVDQIGTSGARGLQVYLMVRKA